MIQETDSIRLRCIVVMLMAAAFAQCSGGTSNEGRTAQAQVTSAASSIPAVTSPPPAPTSASYPTIRVGYLPATHDALLFVALEEKFFQAQKVNVDPREYKNSPDALKALEAGEVDIAIPGIAAPLLRIAGGSNFEVVGGEAWYSAGIVASAELKPIFDAAPRTPVGLLSPLAGKRVGTVTQSTGDAILRSYSLKAGLGDKIHIVTYESPVQLANALKAGEVDAAMLWSPHMSKVEADSPQFKTVLWTSQLVDHPCCRQVCRYQTRQEKHDALVRYLAGLVLAKRFLSDPANAARVLADVKTRITGVSDDLLRRELIDTDPDAKHRRTEVSPNGAPSAVVEYAQMMATAGLIAPTATDRIRQSVQMGPLADAYQRLYPTITPDQAKECSEGGLATCKWIDGLTPVVDGPI